MTSCQCASLSIAGFICPHTHFALLEPSISDFLLQCTFTLGWSSVEQENHKADDTNSKDATAKSTAIPPSPSSPPQWVRCAVVTHHRAPRKTLLSTKLANPAWTGRKYRQVLHDSSMGRTSCAPAGKCCHC